MKQKTKIKGRNADSRPASQVRRPATFQDQIDKQASNLLAMMTNLCVAETKLRNIEEAANYAICMSSYVTGTHLLELLGKNTITVPSSGSLALQAPVASKGKKKPVCYYDPEKRGKFDTGQPRARAGHRRKSTR